MKNITKACIGVDISKKTLDICVNPMNKFFKIANAEDAIEVFVKELQQFDVKQIVCEATGGYEKLLAKTLKKHGYTLWIVDPRRIKGHIVATGCKSKNDKIDAQKIAEFAAKNSPDYVAMYKTENQELLHSLNNRKNDLTKILAAEKTRFKDPSNEACRSSIKNIMQVLKNEIKSIELQIKDVIQQDETLNTKALVLESIPGIGYASAALLLSSVPELGILNNKQISALIGVCPYDRSSGSYVGKKFIKGGRMIPRNMLYMCALTTIKYHLPLKQFYNRLIANKKPFSTQAHAMGYAQSKSSRC
jgi:transposase